MIKAIETQYKGYKFRSRLEARWAVFFDALGLKWEYEPEGFDLGDGVWYLPDFRVQYDGPGDPVIWVEVKPSPVALVSKDEWRKLALFSDNAPRGELVLCDGQPDCRVYYSVDVLLGRGNFAPCYSDGPRQRKYDGFTPIPENEREGCGGVFWSHKERFWWDDEVNIFGGDGVFSSTIGDEVHTIRHAVNCARAARFGKGGRG